MTIGARIKQRRKELGLTVEELANRLGKNRATVYRYESNDIENLPTTVLEPLAEVLKVHPAYLIGWQADISKDEDGALVIEGKLSNIPSQTDIHDNTSSNNTEILIYYSMLNDIGQKEAVKRVKELTYLPDYKKE